MIENGVLTKDGLVALSALTETVPKADPFKSEKPRSKYAGKAFSYLVLFTAPDDKREAGATWIYDLATETLTLSYTAPQFATGHGAQLYFREKNAGTYTGKTATGAKARVHAYAQLRQGVQFLSEPGTGAPTYGLAETYKVSLKVPPERGKALVEKLGVFVSGDTAVDSAGHVSSCDSDHDGATITDPTDLYTRTCAVFVDVKKVEFYSAAAEKPLAEWTSAPPLGSAVPAGVSAGKPAPKPRVITQPTFIEKPTRDQMADAYPDRAQRLGKEGRVTLSCTVSANGMVTACSVVSEDPAGYGFGEAAIRLSRYFKMRRRTEDGSPVDGATVTVPIGFFQAG